MTTLLMFLFAMMSKPMAISLPVVLVALDIYPLRRVTRLDDWRGWLALVAQKWPLLFVAVLVTVFTYLSMRTGNFFNTGEMFPLAERIVNATRSLWLYTLRFIFPLQLSPIYPVAVLDNSISLRNLLPGFGVAIVIGGALYAFTKGRPQWLAAVLAYLAWLVPVSGIVSAGPQSSADRYAYMPGAMFCVVIAVAFAGWWYRRAGDKARRFMLVSGASLWVAWLALTAHQYVGVFRDDETSKQWVAHYFPAWQPFTNYIAGVNAFRKGELAAAEQQLELAIRFNQARARARLHLAMVRQLQGASGIAYKLVRAALASSSHDPYVAQLSAQVLTQLNRGAEAKPLLEKLIEQFPDASELKRQLAQAHLSADEPAKAAMVLDELLARAPEDLRSMTLRAVVAQLTGDDDTALRLYGRVLALDPDNRDAKHNLKRLRENSTKPSA
jgi:tetratricopeptide (TPR) repeat protein